MLLYAVVMGQAIWVHQLGEGVGLITGVGNPLVDGIQSCAAVIMLNSSTEAAGLYHYPAGDLHKRIGAQALMTRMAREINPDQAYIVYGTMTMSSTLDTVLPSDPNSSLLRQFVLRLLPSNCRLRRQPAVSRVAAVVMQAGQIMIDTTYRCNYIDLRKMKENVFYPSIGTIAWDSDE